MDGAGSNGTGAWGGAEAHGHFPPGAARSPAAAAWPPWRAPVGWTPFGVVGEDAEPPDPRAPTPPGSPAGTPAPDPAAAVSPLLDDRAAREVVASAVVGLSPAESLFLRAVARLETRYGNGWKGPGVGSNNWGAVTCPECLKEPGCGANGFEYTDSKWSETQGKVVAYRTCFRRYASPADGARQLAGVLLKPNVRSALATTSLRAAVRAMYSNRFFLGTSADPETNVTQRVTGLRIHLTQISAATGEAVPFRDALGDPEAVLPKNPVGTKPATLGLGGILLAAGVGWLALWALRRQGAPGDAS